jgi:hypothetical protein
MGDVTVGTDHVTLVLQGMGLITWNLALFEDWLVRTLQLLQLSVLPLSYVLYNIITNIFEHYCGVCNCQSHVAQYAYIVGCYALSNLMLSNFERDISWCSSP